MVLSNTKIMSAELNSKITTTDGDFIVFTKTSKMLFMSVPRSSIMPFSVGDFASTPGFQVQYTTSDPRVLAEWHEMLCRQIEKGLFRFLCDSTRVGSFKYPEGKEHLRQYVKRFA